MESIALFLPLAAAGVLMTFKAEGIRNWLVGVYKNQQVARHLRMRGFVSSMRLVGIGWTAFALVPLTSAFYALASH